MPSSTAKIRCTQCKKKLGCMSYKCKCEKLFCITHLHAEAHACTFNYQDDGKAILTKNMIVGPLTSSFERL
jgi:hypothetical protein